MPSSHPSAATPTLPTLSLVIPCYDEVLNLPLLVQRIEACFTPGDTEVILVDNGSTDATPAFLAALQPHPVIRSVRVEVNQGYGYGILAGLRAARGAYVGWTHADMQADPADAMRAMPILHAAGGGAVYVKGQRHGRAFGDVVFTVGMALFEVALLGRPMWDINAQPNILPRAFVEAIAAGAPHDFSLDLFFYYEAKRAGLRIERFPVRFGPRAHGVSHWNVDWTSKRKFIERTIRFSLDLRARVRRGAR